MGIRHRPGKVKSQLRNAIHAFLALLLWIVFVFYWRIVMLRPMNPETAAALITLGVLSFLSALFLGWWIYHNVRIFRRYGRRRTRRIGAKMPIRDYLGRWVVPAAMDRLREAGYVIVEVRKSVVSNRSVEEKVFRAAPVGEDE